MKDLACSILVVAKAPVAGHAKTRLTTQFTAEQSADLAAAALLDTLEAVRRSSFACKVVALVGNIEDARMSAQLRVALDEFVVIPQQGVGFGERLMRAHLDAASLGGLPVLQIGMDTPQLTATTLRDAALTLLATENDVVLGPATDGGWWAIGLSTPDVAPIFSRIAMSQSDTGSMTMLALSQAGCSVVELETMTDVDTPAEVWEVAQQMEPSSHFVRTLTAIDAHDQRTRART